MIAGPQGGRALSLLDAVRSGYSRTFWVANVLELFERLAYYSSHAVLAVYIAEHVGLGPEAAGFLAGSVFNTLLYFLPILAGTVVDRYGFKRSLMACFAIFSVGYLLIGLGGLPVAQPLVRAVGVRTWILIALVVTAIGGSLIKPSIVGTVARTTSDETKALGYSIYYTLVNVGGAVGPLLAPFVRENLGIAYVLVVSSLTSLLLFAGTTLFYREPPRPADAPPARSMAKVLADMVLVFGNLRFILFLVIFSGFWAMFWHVFYALPFYVKDFLKYPRFEWVETVDAIAIIFVTIPATAIAKRLRPLSAMVLGFVLATACWFIMGSVPVIAGAVAGLVVFAVGEGLQSPRFYEYVANLAPPEQVGTYMGFAFLPIAIGTFIAGASSGYLVEHYVEGGNPNAPHMWFVVGSYGVVCTILMVLYDRFVAPKRAAA
jgi:POT family proton-dependent oligopeptide transporter